MQEKELQADLAELRTLETTAQRQNVKNLLKQEIKRLEQNLQLIEKAKPAPEANKEAQLSNEAPKLTQPSSGIYEMLTKYSWDQTDDFVKIYVSLDGVKDSGADAKGSFEKQSFDVKIHGYKNKNFRLSIEKLCEAIDTANSKVVVNSNTVLIKLAKLKKNSRWAQLIYKEDKFKPEDVGGKDKDPSSSLMDMMKKMYEEGDDNMKRTIAEAWTKSKDKKGGDMDGLGGMGGFGASPGMPPGMPGMGGF